MYLPGVPLAAGGGVAAGAGVMEKKFSFSKRIRDEIHMSGKAYVE